MSNVIEYNGYHISVEENDGQHFAHIERIDNGIIAAGVSQGKSFETHRYADPKSALSAAQSAIDTGEVQ